MAYLAGKLLKVGDGYRDYGDEVPEAAEWPSLTPWFNGGFLLEVPDDRVNEIQKAVHEDGLSIEQALARVSSARASEQLERVPSPPAETPQKTTKAGAKSRKE